MRCFHRGMIVWRPHASPQLQGFESGCWAKKRISHFYFIFYFLRGLEHCGPFIRRHIKHQTKSEGSGLPKFDSKILISEQASNIRPSRRSLCRIVTGGGQKSVVKIKTEKKKKHFILFYFYFYFFNESVGDTRSAWQYCKTRATLGQGAAQAPQAPSRGLNNSLKSHVTPCATYQRLSW